MSNVASIRAEIKAWERSFKEIHGKEPTVDDIKNQPAIAQKYKLYKRLSKAASAPRASSSLLLINDPPSTPTRPAISPHSLTPTLRIVEITAPLASFNPFSPHKNKGKQKATDSPAPSRALNPFSSPRKSKSQNSNRQLSPDPFPLIEPLKPLIFTQELPEPSSPVSRARKRLRGEPVSPSPNKGKRQRILSQANLPLPQLKLQGDHDSDSSDKDDGDGKDREAHSLFVDDSPVKPAANGKQFTLLFEEMVKPTSMTDLFGDGVLATKSQAASKIWPSLSSKDEEVVDSDSRSSSISTKTQSSAPAKSRPRLVQSTLAIARKASRQETPPNDRPPAKRSTIEMDSTWNDNDDNPNPTVDPSNSVPHLQLLPPPPNLNTSSVSGKSMLTDTRTHQAAKNTSRKKAKVQGTGSTGDEDEDGSSPDGVDAQLSVKLVHHSRGIRADVPSEEDNVDPILNYARRVTSRDTGSVSPVKQVVGSPLSHGPGKEDEASSEEQVGGSLPDEMRRVLVLESIRSKRNKIEEERIVKELVSGRRVMHYDPGKGGEIWGVGEDDWEEDQEGRVDERGDEWEGEPVPWEVGELSESHYYLEEL